MNEEISEIVEMLENLLGDVPLKAKVELEVTVDMLKTPLDQEGLIKVQDQLELISNMTNIDSFTRSEIYNVLSIIESLI